MQKRRLAVITTHPIQYNAPLFRLLTERNEIDVKVFYTWSQAREKVEDLGFGKNIKWDIPLLEGYEFEFVTNVSKKPGNRNFWGIQAPSLISKIERYTPDALLVFGWNFKSHLDVMRHFKGKVPVWFRGDSHLLDEKPGLKRLVRRLFLKWVYQHVDIAFYVGVNNKAYFLAHGLREDQLVYSPHVVDNERFIDTPEREYELKARQWRRELGYSEEDIVVLFAGKFEQKKNPSLLIKAFEGVFKENNRMKLLMVGNGLLEAELKARAIGNPNIQFLPFQNQSQMPVLYRIGNIFCLPSSGPGETWGLAINEALASGIPAIVSDNVGCAKDFISIGVSVFRNNDDSDLISKLLFVVNQNRINQPEINQAGFLEKWDLKVVCSSLENELIK